MVHSDRLHNGSQIAPTSPKSPGNTFCLFGRLPTSQAFLCFSFPFLSFKLVYGMLYGFRAIQTPPVLAIALARCADRHVITRYECP